MLFIHSTSRVGMKTHSTSSISTFLTHKELQRCNHFNLSQVSGKSKWKRVTSCDCFGIQESTTHPLCTLRKPSKFSSCKPWIVWQGFRQTIKLADFGIGEKLKKSHYLCVLHDCEAFEWHYPQAMIFSFPEHSYRLPFISCPHLNWIFPKFNLFQFKVYMNQKFHGRKLTI